MARDFKKRSRKGKEKETPKRLQQDYSTNYKIFGLGIIVLILGYLSLMQGPVDSFWSLTLAPVLLLIGYLVIIPYSILYQKKPAGDQEIPGKM